MGVLPSGAKTGRTTCSAVAGPEARIRSWPASAGPLVPETGASTNITSGRTLLTCSARLSVAVTPIVPICAHAAPWLNASTTWPSTITVVTTSAVGSIVMTTSASRTASVGEGAASAPAAARAAATGADLSHTAVRNPALRRFRAIAEPMMPVPSTATEVPASLVAVMECLSPSARRRHRPKHDYPAICRPVMSWDQDCRAAPRWEPAGPRAAASPRIASCAYAPAPHRKLARRGGPRLATSSPLSGAHPPIRLPPSDVYLNAWLCRTVAEGVCEMWRRPWGMDRLSAVWPGNENRAINEAGRSSSHDGDDPAGRG